MSQEGKSKASEEEEDIDDAEDFQKPLKTTFELNDTLYAEAELEDTDTVFLWLGVRFKQLLSHIQYVSLYYIISKANVMLSYKIPAAITLLKSKLEVAQTSLDDTIEDLEFLREQLTIMEVNTARVYNWDVKRRRELREADAARAGSIDK